MSTTIAGVVTNGVVVLSAPLPEGSRVNVLLQPVRPESPPGAVAAAAQVLRTAWMRRMGLGEDEIAESIRDDPPLDLNEEIRQLNALDSLDQITPASEALKKYASKY